MKINLGCGDRYASGWINVDHSGSPHQKDETVDLTGALPWPEQSVSYVYAGHVLEHLTLDVCTDLLGRLLRCARPGCEIMVVGPDVERAREMAVAGTLDVTLDSLIYGASRWPGDEHRWECNAQHVRRLLSDTGWSGVTELDITQVPALWPVADRRPRWQCAVLAHA